MHGGHQEAERNQSDGAYTVVLITACWGVNGLDFQRRQKRVNCAMHHVPAQSTESRISGMPPFKRSGRVAESADASDLKSDEGQPSCGFKSRLGQ